MYHFHGEPCITFIYLLREKLQIFAIAETFFDNIYNSTAVPLTLIDEVRLL